MPEPTAPHSLRAALSDPVYRAFRELLQMELGIDLGEGKHALVYSRLMTRLHACSQPDFESYLQWISTLAGAEERQIALDLMTTNETYFFREPDHFRLLEKFVEPLASAGRPVRVWSAASSTGEEAYSIAMVLQSLEDSSGPFDWTIVASDVSTRVLEVGRRGVYADTRLEHFPAGFLKRHTLRGHGSANGTVRIVAGLREQVRWEVVNLVRPLPAIGQFDAIFLRNVLIYFSRDTKRRVVASVRAHLRPGGRLFVGTSESLFGFMQGWTLCAPGVYERPGEVQ